LVFAAVTAEVDFAELPAEVAFAEPPPSGQDPLRLQWDGSHTPAAAGRAATVEDFRA